MTGRNGLENRLESEKKKGTDILKWAHAPQPLLKSEISHTLGIQLPSKNQHHHLHRNIKWFLRKYPSKVLCSKIDKVTFKSLQNNFTIFYILAKSRPEHCSVTEVQKENKIKQKIGHIWHYCLLPQEKLSNKDYFDTSMRSVMSSG